MATEGPSCPACTRVCANGPDRHFDVDEAAQHFVLREEYPQRHYELVQHIRDLWASDRCASWTCRACGMGFAQPFVAGDGAFYNMAYPYTHYPERRWEFEASIRSLDDAALVDGPVLEIGSGFGWFLRRLAPRFVAFDQIVSLEFNEQATPRLSAMGCHVHSCDVRDRVLDKYSGQLAAVFMFQVLEHMDDLDALIVRLNDLVRPGGDIFVAVPNKQRLDFNAAHGSLLDMPPNHLSQWTTTALRAFAARAGWRVSALQREPLGWHSFMKQDLTQSHVRRAQVRGSLANRVRCKPRSNARSVAEAGLALAAIPERLPAWAEARRRLDELGESLWARFKR